ncbi:hypothetical protein [Nocardia abscessus]|uniref:hypothetical protein n=1 Tax=Nocardia abscessus TaxID=120957 RepID=UPI002457E6A5|nr:hypothetical protein [Nocardia abscessus]
MSGTVSPFTDLARSRRSPWYAGTVRACLDVPEDLQAPVNAVGRTRILLQQSVVLHGTPGILDGQYPACLQDAPGACVRAATCRPRA